ncbi:2Fe-2S iron-sulfur cluster-binding protein [Pseudanabaena sp. UWO310]|uniref:2Fe-2S iron-sulfur cluster-binding protein n=1 Tax=Pseudanabaena sp. UWO310 TaxID=2480795 RepID=UPI00115B7EF5|nr:2Fe-2S iron-sulfur cluster-binding protein [Pseudanabaena sp. UWO310]TYQ27472.1 2Fe-2S iron-sulfur cluster binding domain-containing protein [Pseudanabaena sp. UWO310]
MLEEIREISNPLFRAITSGIFLSTLVTIPITASLYLFNPRNEATHKLIVFVSLASAAIGTIGGVATGKSRSISSKSTASLVEEVESSTEWKDWRKFVIARKVKESESITSFYLKPVDGGNIPNHIPGQFLTIQLDIPDQPKPIIRTYSLSDYLESPDYYRLSIKREPAPPDTIAPPGVASNFMHDSIHEGSIIAAKPPAGKFVLDLSSPQPAVLISNGVGITPMISMAKAATLLNPQRHIWFLHGARDGSLHAFRDEVNAIAEHNPNLHIAYSYSRPTADDEGQYQHKGYVDANLIKSTVAPEMEKLCGSSVADYFLCGSPSFMDSLRDGLREWGVPDKNVLFESFAKAKPKKSEQSQEIIPRNENSDAIEVVFSKSGKAIHWNPDQGSILEFAEANEIYPDHSCRVGVCGTCACKISEGEVEYEEKPTASVENGSVLICISEPKTAKIILDI